LLPEHVSIYMLDREERSAWGSRMPSVQADEDFAIFYEESSLRLAAAGYIQYEISNWARPGSECLHNLGYWTGVPYRGFGVSAHSYDGVQRFWNTSSMHEYASRIDDGHLPISGTETLTRQMKIEERFMLGLRQTSGFDVRVAASELDLNLLPEWMSRVDELEQAGMIEFDGTILKLTPRGRLVASSVTEELIWASPASQSSIFEAIQ
jgi:oxygen-independent coproporphyrinogen-3 oxidase